MTKHIAPIIVLCAVVFGAPVIAAAEMQTPAQARLALEKAKRRKMRMSRLKRYRARFDRESKRGPNKVAKPRVQVPELDPNAANGGVAMVLGGVLVLAGRRRRRVQA